MIVVLYIYISCLLISFVFNVWCTFATIRKNNDGIYFTYVNREDFERDCINIAQQIDEDITE